MAKLRVAVIFGGASSEHEVSLMSAASVLDNLSAEKFEAFPIGITKDGRWLYCPAGLKTASLDGWETSNDCVPAYILPDNSVKGFLISLPDGGFRLQKIDAAFPVLHGKYGEDGTVQGLFSLAGIPCVGSDTLSSAVCLDKEFANIILESAGIPRAPWGVIRSAETDRFEECADRWERSFGYPMFIKPANAGSSIGVSKVKNRAELKEAVRTAFLHDGKVIAEKAIAGKELECAVLGNDCPEASVPSEIVPRNEFYDFEAKYDAPSEVHLPARIEKSVSDKLRETAKKAYALLGCGGMARVDFFLEEKTGALLINELNTIPGFTSISMYAKMMAFSGVPYPLLLEKLIDLAIERSAR